MLRSFAWSDRVTKTGQFRSTTKRRTRSREHLTVLDVKRLMKAAREGQRKRDCKHPCRSLTPSPAALWPLHPGKNPYDQFDKDEWGGNAEPFVSVERVVEPHRDRHTDGVFGATHD